MAPTDRQKKPQTETLPNPVGVDNTVPPSDPPKEPPAADTAAPPTSRSDDKTSQRSSWYDRTWPRKTAAPITQVAKESISSAGNTASEVVSSVKQTARAKTKRSPSIQLTLGRAKSSRSTPADATTTKVNALSRESASSPTSPAELPQREVKRKDIEYNQPGGEMKRDTGDPRASTVKIPSDETSADKKPLKVGESLTPANGSPGWLGWFSKPGAEPEKTTSSSPTLKSPDPPLPPPETPVQPNTSTTDTQELPPVPEEVEPSNSKRSWLQMLSGGSPTDVKSAAVSAQVEGEVTKPSAVASSGTNSSAASGSHESLPETSAPPSLPGDGSKSAGWVFWSRDRKTGSSSSISNEPHMGEIAVSDTPSQKRPRKASIDLSNSKETNASRASQPPATKGLGSLKAKENLEPTSKHDGVPPIHVQQVSDTPEGGITTPKSAKFPAQDTGASKQLQASAPNLLLPSFTETFSYPESPSLLQLLSRLLNYNKSSENRYLHRVKETPKLKTALAIGVHGYFPAPLIRTVLGQPTGTSIKFADMATKAIRRWTERHGYQCEVKTAALEGEGRIAERVDLLWKLLLNWIDEIRKADFVMVACHSQGVPVAMMLVAKLVDFGCLNSAKIGICAMAGVSLGPFPDYKSRWIGGTAGELFDFSRGSSTVSKEYLIAVETVLKFGVRVVYVGSIDDQLVSLDSSTFSPISHPHIYRAVFVDGRIHAPNFLVHLVGFVLKLRNLGVQDHGLIRELSGPLAGSLYGGEGHSRIYEDSAVYDLAVEFALETSTSPNTPLSQKPNGTPSTNPYILPWAVRGVLEEDFVKSELRVEANELLRQFDDWRPTTKALKDVKFRLEGIRSKL